MKTMAVLARIIFKDKEIEEKMNLLKQQLREAQDTAREIQHLLDVEMAVENKKADD